MISGRQERTKNLGQNNMFCHTYISWYINCF